MTNDEWRSGVNVRLKAIEDEMIILKTKGAVDEVHRANVETRLTKIESVLSRLVWLIITALGAAIMGYALQGGFGIV